MGSVTRWSVRLASLCAGLMFVSAAAAATDPSVDSVGATADAAQVAPATDAAKADPQVNQSLDPSTPVVAKSEAAATARATTAPVVVKESLTETAAELVWPDGSRSEEIFAGTVRVRSATDPSGWKPLDLTLVDGKDGIHSRSAATDIVLSDGGLNPVFARVPFANGAVEMVWNGILPAPTLSGATASYPDVQPGIDLIVTMRAHGVKVGFLVHAKPKAPLSLPVQIRGVGGVSVQVGDETHGVVSYVDEKGTELSESEPPVMFDASGDDPKTGDPVVRQQLVASTFAHAIDGLVQTLTPDPAFFEQPNLTYPVTVDPSTADDVPVSRDTFLSSDTPTTGHNGEGDKVGTNNQANVLRVLLRFSDAGANGGIGPAEGDIVDTATLNMYLYEVASACEPTRTFRLYESLQLFSDGQYWNSWSPVGWPDHDGVYFAASAINCTLGAYKTISTGGGNTTDHADLAKMVQHWANDPNINRGMILKATDEPSQDTRRHFRDMEAGSNPPKLSLLFHSGVAPAVDTTAALSHPNGVAVYNGTFSGTFKAQNAAGFTPADFVAGDAVRKPATWEFLRNGVVYSTVNVTGASLTQSVTIPLVAGANQIQARVKRADGYWSPVSTAWSAVYTTVAPVISASSSHPVSTLWYDSVSLGATVTVGAPVTTASVAGYAAVLDQAPSTIVPTTTPLLPSSASVTSYIYSNASPEGAWWLHVRVKDVKGNWSPTAHRLFKTDTAGSAASTNVGPGEVDLRTGNLTLAATDFSGGGLTVPRVFNSRVNGGAAGSPYGPGWVGSMPIDESVAPFRELKDNTVTGGQPGTVKVEYADGDSIDFVGTYHAASYTPPEEQPDLELTYASTSDTFTLTDTLMDTVTTFSHPAGAPVGRYAPTVARDGTGAASNASYSWVSGAWRVVVAAAPPDPSLGAVNCLATTPVPVGCRQLQYRYASADRVGGLGSCTNQAAAPPYTNLGDKNGQVSSVEYWSSLATRSSPTTVLEPAPTGVTVVQYKYGQDGRLCEATDPRSGVTVRYRYNAAGDLISETPAGEHAWSFTYQALTALGDSATAGRLRSVQRATVLPATGTATTTVVYGTPCATPCSTAVGDVPLTAGNGRPGMLDADVAAWGQADKPEVATAVFPPYAAAPASPPTSFSGATIYYMDTDGRTVNVAAPGLRVSTTEYDAAGNVVRELTAANRQRALAADPNGLNGMAQALDTDRVYDANGVDVVDEYGPLHPVQLANGTNVSARAHTHYIYDEGLNAACFPSGAHLATTITTGAAITGQADSDVRTTKLGYDDQTYTVSATSPASVMCAAGTQVGLGWVFGAPTSKTTDAVAGGLNIKSVTLYDAVTGHVIEQRQASNASSAGAGTQQVTYYSGATTGQPCSSKAWAGLVCQGSQPPSSTPALPVSWVTQYDRYDQPQTTDETIGTSTRTTTITYDAAGRVGTQSVASPVGDPISTLTTSYDATTGRAFQTTGTFDGSVRTVSRGYDLLGRPASYTDADGVISTTQYDIADRPQSVSDGKGTTTYTYDPTTGLPATKSDSVPGVPSADASFTVTRYDDDGAVLEETLPGGIQACAAVDATGAATSVVYRAAATPSCTGTILSSSSQVSSIHGQWLASQSLVSGQGYSYDPAGRLTRVRDSVAGSCTERTYDYDVNSNRISQASRAPGAAGACDGSGVLTSGTHAYDAVDKVADAGYSFDVFGRATTVPATASGNGQATSVTYYVNDLVHTLQKGVSGVRTYKLDALLRVRAWDDATDATTHTNHYTDGSDSPAWTAENTSGSEWTRMIGGIGQYGLVAQSAAGAVLQYANLHGDIVAAAPASNPTALTTFESTEFGVPRAGNPSQRYSWLGVARRASDVTNSNSGTNVILMGQRLYVPNLGRFLQMDPVYGGSASDYDYCSGDPVNCSDPSGRCGICIGGFVPVLGRIIKWAKNMVKHHGRYCTSSPDHVIGDYRSVCQYHDQCYAEDSTTPRLTCDRNLRSGIRRTCREAGGPEELCKRISTAYYWGVRCFGHGAYGGRFNSGPSWVFSMDYCAARHLLPAAVSVFLYAQDIGL